jgi:hypothetical protein
MEKWSIIIVAVGLLIIITELILRAKKNRISKRYPYKRKYILTMNEYNFYRALKPICDKYNLRILIKTRIADIVDVDKSKINSKDYFKYFSKIQAKHIDFLLCSGDSLYVVAGLELDDSSHDTEKRMERDEFVNNVFNFAGIPLIRCRGAENLEELIREYLPNSQNK